MKNNREMVYDCTSNNFDGYVVCFCCLPVNREFFFIIFSMIALANPDDSWVAKWQRISLFLLI